MDEEDDDIHFCLICNKTVPGLANYINHKKNECSGRKGRIKSENSPQNTVSIEESGKFENQSFPNLHKQGEHLNQSYQNDSFGAFTTTSPNSVYHDDQSSFLNSVTGTIGTAEQTIGNQLEATSDVYKRILSCTTQSTSQENIFLSTQLNLSETSQMTLNTNTLSCSLSPIFSTTETAGLTKGSDLTAETEDFGLLSASVSGNRNNTPIQEQYKSSDHLKVKVNDLPNADQIAKGECDQVEDFFQSLELMSKTDPRADKGSNFTQLPISNILNNLTFSDDEDLGFDFGDDMSLDSLSDDEDGRAPPGSHTGGKWKPGEKPLAYRKYRQRFHGKWPPGERPPQTAIRGRRGPSSRGKNIALIPGHKPKHIKKEKKTASKSTNKIFVCNFCDITFFNRFQYSSHCGTKSHKENVLRKNESLENVIAKKESLAAESQEPKNATVEIENKTNDEVESGIENQERLNPAEGIFENLVEENSVQEKKIENNNFDEYSDGNETDEYFEETGVKMGLNEAKVDVNNTRTAPPEEMKYIEVALKLHICTVCDKKFSNKYMLARHLLTKFHQNRSLANKEYHNELIQKYHKCIVRLSPFQCGICRFYFNSNEDFVQHLKGEDHKENCEDLVGEIQCTLCRFKTHSREEVDQHIESADHVEKIGKRNRICIIKECHAGCVCKFCGLKMHSFERLQRHIKLKHADGKVVSGVQKKVIGVRNRPKCPECNLQLASFSALTVHMRRRHTKEKPYQCEVCSKAFADKHAHKLHLKSTLHSRRKLTLDSNENDATDTDEIADEKERHETEDKELDQKSESKELEKEALTGEAENTKSSQVQMDDIADVNEDETVESGLLFRNDLGIHDEKDKDWVPKITGIKKRTGRSKSKGESCGYSQKDKKSIKCNHCSFTVKDYDDLRPHYMKEHSAQIRICELCDTVFLSEKALKLHVLSKEHQANIELSSETNRSTEMYFQCHVCKKKFTDEKYCKFHTAYQHFHSTTEQEVYKQSGYKSVTRDKFADFLKSVENIGYKEPIQCPECDTVIKKSNLMVHLRNHTNERPFLCKICPNTFKSNYTLRKHLLKHFGCLERDCDICGKHFNKPSNYEEHLELHALQKANKEKTHVCDVCGQAFYVERQLAVHLRRHRSKDLKCDHPGCHWTFAFRHELNAHKRTHSNERKYLCDTCGFAAYEKYHLRRHEKIHKNERKFHCEYCTYKAGNKTHLRRHMRIHIGSKPFKCPYCNFACNTHENIRKHILETKKHEGLKVYPCKFCEFGTNNSKEFRGHLMSNHAKESDDGARQMPLSVFTGLFQKEEDIDRPPEGTKVLPCKERKIKKKDESEKNGENQFDSSSDWTDSKQSEASKKNKRKRKSDTFQYVIENQDAYDLSMKDRRMSYPAEMMKNDYSQVSQSYPTGLVVRRETPSPPYAHDHVEPYRRFQEHENAQVGVNAHIGVNAALDLGIRHVQHGSHQVQNPGTSLAGPYGEQGFMKVNQEEMMQYHDYSTKFGVSRNREDSEETGNLIIDMNFQPHH
ncbi:zinc finger protein 62 homolog [Mercenaria mercenaria]|uniref:zinc finger protein 62 homolog n=1 Tax=Mercenaria mercenaria TaxID=6596 RepID=UPI00234F51D9|nr:zinc finger protein 62 homolog [Mercenaria mercenaria]